MDQQGEDTNQASTESSTENSGNSHGAIQPPTISLPTGGGAIRGIGEKFAANPVTGTGAMSVPIATSPGRAGFAPELTLSYDSGAGNGPFGFGWTLSLPAITRKTDKGLPRYLDAEESDVFILSGAEDLVPFLDPDGSPFEDRDTFPDYLIHRYRPRVEGLFARIERWTRKSDGDVHWRSISRDNILTLYGKDANSRIADPEDPSRIFNWLICETRDDKGNAVLYGYKPEDGAGVDLTRVHERNRGERDDPRRTANRYIKHIRYGNRRTLLIGGSRPSFLDKHQVDDAEWMFEVVFDYGEHLADAPTPADAGEWHFRNDPFSKYRAGFELRTTRLCQRVLMFHHFDSEEGVGNDCLVRSTNFTYSHEQDPLRTSNPVYTFLRAVAQAGYKREGSGYRTRGLPPVEFEYTEPLVQDTVEDVAAESLENLPVGLDGTVFQWTDLHGEGIPGILTEQAGGWYFKRNLAPINEIEEDGTLRTKAKFAPLERVSTKPNLALAGGAQFMDLAGDGQPDLVMLGGPAPGLYEHDAAESWQPFRPFTSRLNRDLRDPNLKFIDLDGDGHADVMITEDDAFVWYASLAEVGFGPARRVHQALDEEHGPRLVFADGTQSIYLADLSGDGLTDLIRIRNGEVCYWPNLGYCRFGAKITMDNAPHFDHPDQFNHQRVRLADIDGSGTIDIIYLHRDGVRLYFNQSGNSWSAPQVLRIFPRVDELVSIVPVDLLGNGTACLVWSSPLPGDVGHQMRYVNLMGPQKPHLLVKTINNLGAETQIQYAPSTKFYLQDKRDGKPWVTKLPFPVHVVEKVTATDKWRNTRFATTYSYHHGHFDGTEREFRGFGRVEQIDVETFGEFAAGNPQSPYVTDDRTLYQPPVKTVSWYHTGAFIDRDRILSQYEEEYFPNVLGGFRENALPEPDIQSDDLSADEWRQALRACKGMMLRQESYELDVDALETGEERPIRLFSTAYHNCHIRRLQAQGANRHAVFLVTESEAITYNYELDLRTENLSPDPRIAHTLNLQVDDYGNVLQSIAAVYLRIGRHQDATLPPGTEALIAQVQNETHLAYTENRFTNAVAEPGDYRLPLPCEVLAYELTGIAPADRYFSLDELRDLRLSNVHQSAGTPVTDIPYHTIPDRRDVQKRLVEHARMLYFHDDLTAPLVLGEIQSRALPYETYTLALTDDLLGAILRDKFTDNVRADLNDETLSGYLSSADLAARFPGIDTSGQYWVRSGIAGFADDAAEHFYLPERYTDPFGNTTTLRFDPRDLYIESSRDPVGNTVTVEQFDFRVLAPSEMRDINGNVSQVVFDALGLPAATAIKGKGNEADRLDLSDDLIDPDITTRSAFFTGDFNTEQARALLGSATARHIYYFGETRGADDSLHYGDHPPCAAGILREQHTVTLEPGEGSPLQIGFEYSDGGGNVLVKKIQAEPEPSESPRGPLRWIASGKTILNNKGKPVKQYEPYFSENELEEPNHRFEEPREVGVTPIMYYDAAGRLIRTELPDGTYSRVTFSPWQVTSYDPSDTVKDSRWYTDRAPPDPELALPRDLSGEITASADQRAAWLAAHHHDTPATTILDSLGRDVISIAHNRVQSDTGTHVHGGIRYADVKYVTFTKLDAEGKPLWIRDARGNRVMQYISPPVLNDQAIDPTSGFVPCYDIAGNLLFQHSMDAGDRWIINDAAGQPFYAWDENQRVIEDGSLLSERRVFHTTYDALRRPLTQQLQINNETPQMTDRFIYGDLPDLFPARPAGELPEAMERNLRGQVYQSYDPSGLVTSQRFDFKGNLLEATRELASAYRAPVIDWSEDSPTNGLESELFTQRTEYDALNRMVGQHNWHLDGRSPAIYTPQYNARGLLASETITVHGVIAHAIRAIDYDAKGQRTRLHLGNGTITRYEYHLKTFRLNRLHTTGGDGSTALQDVQYTYDPVGNITKIRDEAQQTVFFDNARIEPHSTYEYDALYRLSRATGREHAVQNNGQRDGRRFEPLTSIPFSNSPEALQRYTEEYQYDSVGNILSMAHAGGRVVRWKRCYQYALDSNRLLATGGAGELADPTNPCPSHYVKTATLSQRYAYDTHGSMLNLHRTPDEYRLHWDTRDMLHHANLGGGGQAWYNYDSGKQRTRKRIERNGSTVEERLYLGGMELYRRWVGDAKVEEIETHHLFADDQRVLIVEDVRLPGTGDLPEGVRYRYQYGNHLGSVGLELDADAAIISYEEYHPYGTTAYQARNVGIRATAKRYRYTGMERDEETGLSYHTARYYLPWLGRWCSSDPIAIAASPNVYEYSNCRPMNYRDSSGLQSQSGLSISPTSQLSAQDIYQMIQTNNNIPAYMKAVFSVEANHLLLANITNAPERPPAWFMQLASAIQHGGWEFTTATAIENDAQGFDLRPDLVASDLPGLRLDERRDSRGVLVQPEQWQGRPQLPVVDQIVLGETLPVEGQIVTRRDTRGRLILDDQGQRQNEVVGLGMRRDTTERSNGHRGLVVVANRFRAGHAESDYYFNANRILETLFHELIVHAGNLEIGEAYRHGAPEVERLSNEIERFFNPDFSGLGNGELLGHIPLIRVVPDSEAATLLSRDHSVVAEYIPEFKALLEGDYGPVRPAPAYK